MKSFSGIRWYTAVYLGILMIGLASASFYIGDNNYGDDFEDAAVNSTFWAFLIQTSGDIATVTEEASTDGYIRVHTQATDDGSDSHGIATLNLSKNLNGVGDVKVNMTLNVTTGGSGSSGNLQGNVQIRVNDGGTQRVLFTRSILSGYAITKEDWYIDVDASTSTFTLYNETGTVGSEVMTTDSWVLNFYSISEEPVAGGGTGGTYYGDIALFNITVVSEFPQVELDSPANASSTANPIPTATIRKGINPLANATVYVWDSNGAIVNQTTNTISGDLNTTTYPIGQLSNGEYHWNVYGCDDQNNCEFADSNFTFTYGFETISETFTTPVVETQDTDFELNITIPQGTVISLARFYYNNTQYTVTPTSIGGNNYSLSQTVTAPNVGGDTNIDFNWEVIFTDGFNQNTTTQQQSVQQYQGLTVGASCSAGFDPALTFSFKTENLTSISSNAEYNIQYGINVDTPNLVVFGNISSVPSFSVCINASLPFVYTGDAQIKYGDGIYVERNFFVFNEIQLSNVTTNHTLYNLPASESTSFLVKVRDNALTPLSEKYVSLLRWYPELNEYKIVEMARTDSDGQTVMKVITEDIDYKFAVYEKNGTLLKLTDPVQMVCLVNPCEYIINVDELTNFISFSEIVTNLTHNNNTGIFTFTWSDPNQLTTLMNLTVYKLSTTSPDTIVCSSSSTSFTGTIACDASGQTGTLKAIVTRSASPAIILDTLLIEIRETIVAVGGGELGLFLSFILVLFVALASLINPILGIVGAVIAMVPAMLLGGITKAVFIAIAMMGVIVAIMMGRSNR